MKRTAMMNNTKPVSDLNSKTSNYSTLNNRVKAGTVLNYSTDYRRGQHFGVQGQAFKVRLKDKSSPHYHWGQIYLPVLITAEYPNFLIGKKLYKDRPVSKQLASRDTITINKYDLICQDVWMEAMENSDCVEWRDGQLYCIYDKDLSLDTGRQSASEILTGSALEGVDALHDGETSIITLRDLKSAVRATTWREIPSEWETDEFGECGELEDNETPIATYYGFGCAIDVYPSGQITAEVGVVSGDRRSTVFHLEDCEKYVSYYSVYEIEEDYLDLPWEHWVLIAAEDRLKVW